MIQYLKITGKNIARAPTSGIETAKQKIIPSGVIAATINHQQNAASGRFYLSSDGATIRYVDHYCSIDYNDSITKFY